MQILTIVGNVGRDSVLRYIPSGTAVADFSLAENRVWKDKNGAKQSETTWFKCTLWGAYAEAMSQYIVKGKPLSVTGRLKPDRETGAPTVYKREDGTYGAQYEVTVSEIGFISGAGNGNGGSQPESDSIDLGTTNEEISFID